MFGLALAFGLVAGSPDACAYDRRKLLALDQQSFDQDLTGGWRAVASNPRCNLAAADLIHDYRILHPGPREWSLFWHEGQLRAEAGQTRAAIALFAQSRRSPDDTGWNFYVEGTVAFLKHDRKALVAARQALAALPRPPDWNGAGAGSIHLLWPLNLNVLDGFLACFDRGYAEAYGPACTKPIVRIEVPDEKAPK